MENYNFSYAFRVRYSEIDGQKIVFNAHYSSYLDLGITEYFRGILGSEWITDPTSFHFDPVLVKTTIEFVSPATLDDMLTIYVRAKRIGNTSLTFEYQINREEQVILKAETIQVNYDFVNRKSTPLPDMVKEKIKQFEALIN